MAWDYRHETEIEKDFRGQRLIDLKEVERFDKNGVLFEKQILTYDDRGFLEKSTTIYYGPIKWRKWKNLIAFLKLKPPIYITKSLPNRVLIQDAGGGTIDEKEL
jgi:hypothetical protein